MYRLLVCLVVSSALWCEIVDRIAITVEHQVITQLQIYEELRVTAFLNHARISEDLQSRRAAADRVVEQILVAREMQLSHYPSPPSADVDRYMNQIRQTFDTDTAYEAALSRYRITENILKEHLADQLQILSFIELRFRPNLDTQDAQGVGSQRREELTDQILDTWLEEARKQVSIVYLDKALQ